MERRLLRAQYTTATARIALIIVLITLPLLAPPNQRALVKAITLTQCSNRSTLQQELMQSLHAQKSPHLDCTQTLEALLIDNTTPFLTEHAETLLKAITLFHHINGFRDTFFTLLSHAQYPQTASGFLYELEVALQVHEHGECVLSFGRRHESHRDIFRTNILNREIDVETKSYWFECKNIHWEKVVKADRQEKLKRQLLDEHQLAMEQNQHVKRPKMFVLCSKQPIPENWQEWLNEQEIEYICTSEESSYALSSDQE